MSDPKHIHWVAAKHVLRYVRATITNGLRYTSSSGILLAQYVDSDWAGSVVYQKSTLGYCFIMVSVMISWSSKKQGSIAHNTVEVEYIAASDACKEAVWLRKLLSDLFDGKLSQLLFIVIIRVALSF